MTPTSTPRQEFDPDVEAIEKAWRRNVIRSTLVLSSMAAWIIAIGILLKISDKQDADLAPAHEDIQFKISEETKSLLTSEVRELLAKLESGQVSGHFEKEFRSVLKQATLVEKFDRRWHTYHFALGKKKIEELDPIITVVVERRTGRIIRCSVWTCCS